MQFLIADTFTSSLGKLTDNEQKQVKTSAFDMQMNPANPGLQFHKLNAARDPNFWSVRSIAIFGSSSTGPRAGSCCVTSIIMMMPTSGVSGASSRHIQRPAQRSLSRLGRRLKKSLFPPTLRCQKSRFLSTRPKRVYGRRPVGIRGAGRLDSDLLAANEDQILELVDHLPAEAAEAVIELAAGGIPAIPEKPKPDEDPLTIPTRSDVFEWFEDADMLALALDYPWEKWTVFLHPSQKAIVEKKFNGPARVSGSAGTGKTIVALHRAVFLARQDHEARILLTTFSDPLARNLEEKLRILCGSSPRLRERVEVASLNSVALRLAKSVKGMLPVADEDRLLGVLTDVLQGCEYSELGSEQFVIKEWLEVVDAWQLDSWEPTATSNGWGVKLASQRTNASVSGLFLSNLRSD